MEVLRLSRTEVAQKRLHETTQAHIEAEKSPLGTRTAFARRGLSICHAVHRSSKTYLFRAEIGELADGQYQPPFSSLVTKHKHDSRQVNSSKAAKQCCQLTPLEIAQKAHPEIQKGVTYSIPYKGIPVHIQHSSPHTTFQSISQGRTFQSTSQKGHSSSHSMFQLIRGPPGIRELLESKLDNGMVTEVFQGFNPNMAKLIF